MKLYVDTAVIAEIEELNNWGVLSGVTTNPSLIVKSGQDFKQTIIDICNLVRQPVSAEVTAEDADGMIEQGLDIATWHENVVVKLPTTPAGLIACKALTAKNIKTNMTLCFSVNQAILCARAGATYVSPFIGRLEDIGADGLELINQIRQVFDIHEIKTEIIAASIRTSQHVTDSALAGAHIATIPPKILKNLVNNPLTDKGLELFMNDWKSTQK